MDLFDDLKFLSFKDANNSPKDYSLVLYFKKTGHKFF